MSHAHKQLSIHSHTQALKEVMQLRRQYEHALPRFAQLQKKIAHAESLVSEIDSEHSKTTAECKEYRKGMMKHKNQAAKFQQTLKAKHNVNDSLTVSLSLSQSQTCNSTLTQLLLLHNGRRFLLKKSK